MKARHSLATVSCVIGLAAVAGLLALPEGIIGQDSKPVAKVQQAEAGQSWTCPMHPQLTRHDQGRCPICAMSLVRTKRDESAPLASLDQMLGIAMKHNPDVRAGRAKLLAAEAEFDRTKLLVVQKVIAYRERWKAQKAALAEIRLEVQQTEDTFNQSDLSDAQKNRFATLLFAKQQKLSLGQARLREIEAELPFLLGRNPDRDTDNADTGTLIVKDRLIPMLEQLIRVSTEAYRKGEADLSDTIGWSRRLAELKVQTAATNTEQTRIIKDHIVLLKNMQQMAEQRYKAGQATVKDVLAAQIQVAEAELWLEKVSATATK